MIAEQTIFRDTLYMGNALEGDAIRWEAVLSRDARFDGEFVYAVSSTEIYCKPSCPSRRPKREHVTFFEAPEAAEANGFRPCKRCQPKGKADDPNAEVVRLICDYIEENHTGEKPITLAALGEHVGLSPFHLQRVFKQATGITPRQYAESLRMGQLKARLKEGDNVTNAVYEAGYGSSSRLYETAPGQLGMTPTEYRRGGAQTRIAYTVVPCTLGTLMVAATEKGICSVSLGDAGDALQERLAREFPAAQISRDDAVLGDWVAAILRHIEGKEPQLDLPVDVRATIFQRRVWEALRSIPYGTTRSYAQVAQAIGDPKATRAVAQACATNPVALVVPCHRVVRSDGGIGGYRWGAWRKETLLRREQEGTMSATSS
ncbi:MAG TPA: bifunctional DNA-binding transcriptional regulator/O6-methylguanine-DNA methyltransferase Ada [Chloroflexia bacterium]|nr:bifunctional DNA-binding transcriptional regulator/O6-methylguanine-DNA methyltransferase Ada [Chloroflexia bacterium]